MIYKCLIDQVFQYNGLSIRPIRYEDRINIMTWRNEQMYHLRQSSLLTEEDQDYYFQNIVSKLFDLDQPGQVLFSYLDGDTCIGYGGLVHINWIDRNAEISFIMNTELERDHFQFHWKAYLGLIEKVAFSGLSLHKIYTFAFDLRPHLYDVLESADYCKEAILKDHCFFDGQYKDVLIHSKWNPKLMFRKPIKSDAKLYLEWANDPVVRKLSYQSDEISYESHLKWFETKLNDENCIMYLFYFSPQKHVGQIRIQKLDEANAEIGVSIDKHFRGKGLASEIISKASADFLEKHKLCVINAYIKEENISSCKGFEKAGYIFLGMKDIKGANSFHYTKSIR